MKLLNVLFLCGSFLLCGELRTINFSEWSNSAGDLHNKGLSKQNLAHRSFTPVADAIEDILGVSLKEKIFAYARKENAIIQDNPFKDKKANVRIGKELAEQEKAFLKVRAIKTKRALEKFLGKSLEDCYIPRIAFCASGGGYRALIATVGSLMGAQIIGLLDTATYMAALSGSAWTLAAWTAIGSNIAEFKEYMIPRLSFGLTNIRSASEAQGIASLFIAKYFYNQPLGCVDPYGALIANALLSHFGQMRQRVYLSDQCTRVEKGDWLFPIYTAASVDENRPTEWYEFTPYEVGGTWLGAGGAFVPSWAYGRKFYAGVCVNNAPPQSLGYMMGMFGSAFAATFSQIYESINQNIENVLVRQAIGRLIESIGKKRLACAQDFNFTAGLSSSPVSHLPTLKLADAGVDFNLPLPPLLRAERAVDVIIMLDASEDIKGGSQLPDAFDYARRKGINMPQFDYSDIEQRACTIFKNEQDPRVPVIIYLPRIKDHGLWHRFKGQPDFKQYVQYLQRFDPEKCVESSYADTMNFSYKEWQVRQLSALTEFNIRASKELIVDALNWVIEKRSK